MSNAVAWSDRDAQSTGPSDSARGSIVAGIAILAVFFGGLGTWAFLAPLNGAIIGEAVVKVEGNRKSVQHMDGGIVRDVRVQDGARVGLGDVLVVLDDTGLAAERDVLLRQQAVLRATEARLAAELSGSATIGFPAGMDSPAMAAAMAAQQQEFDTRRTALAGEVRILEQRIAQLDEQISGYEAREASTRAQLASVREELVSLNELFASGYITKPRLLQLERTATGLEGEIASIVAAIAGARQNVTEYQRQIEQLRRARAAEVTAAISSVQARLLDVEPRLRNVEAALGRMEIRAPYAGEVVDLAVHSVGAVVPPGGRVLDIVPAQTGLVVEARIAVTDIADLNPGMPAEVHFTSYKQRTIPIIHGEVTAVSADRLFDQRTGEPYYLAEVAVDPEELAASPEIRLYPGMPATVMVTTRERSAFDYLLGPLVASLDRSFRQP